MTRSGRADGVCAASRLSWLAWAIVFVIAAWPALADEAAAENPYEREKPAYDITAANAPRDLKGAREITLSYRFSVGGIGVGHTRMTALVTRDGYVLRSYLRTDGLAEAFFRSRYLVRATGTLDEAGRVTPRSYHSDFIGGRSSQVVMIEYEDGKAGPVYSDPAYGVRLTENPVIDTHRRDSVDPLSAMMFVLTGATAAAEKPCGAAVPVFDGRRRYNLEFEYQRTERVRIRGGRVHDGQAHRCHLLYRRIAGFKDDGERDEDELPVPPLDVWVAEYKGGINGAPWRVPLRALASTPIGPVVMILDEFEVRDLTEDSAVALLAELTDVTVNAENPRGVGVARAAN
jgi:hypothetical protein